jgi:hypothetical protein
MMSLRIIRRRRDFLGRLAALLSTLAISTTGFTQSVPVGASYITNGDFENGFTSWTIETRNTSINSTSPLFGTGSLRVTASAGVQIVTTGIEPGATIRVSGYGRLVSAADLATLGVEFYNASNKRILNQWIQVKGTAAKLYSFDIRIPNGTARMQLYALRNVGTQPADFDNLNLTKVANP